MMALTNRRFLHLEVHNKVYRITLMNYRIEIQIMLIKQLLFKYANVMRETSKKAEKK